MAYSIERSATPGTQGRDQLELDRRTWVRQLLNEGLEELRIATFGRSCR